MRQKPVVRRLPAIVVACVVSACLLGIVVRAALGGAARRFHAVCSSIAVGEPASRVRTKFTALGQPLTLGESMAGTGSRVTEHSWFLREEPARWHACSIEVGLRDMVVRVHDTRGTDFENCTDAVVYPHRHLLCAALDALLR